MNRLWVGLGSVLLLLAIGAYFWLRQAPPQLPPPAPPISVVPPPAVAPVEPAIKYPVPTLPGATELPPLEQADDFVKERIAELLNGSSLKTFLQTERFVRRVVATVDNLPRSLAPPRMWPVHTTPGRFTVEAVGTGASSMRRTPRAMRRSSSCLNRRTPGARLRCTSSSTRCYSAPARNSAIRASTLTTG